MTRKFIGVLAMMALLIGMLVVPATATVGGDFGACDGLEWLKYEYDEGVWESSGEDAPSSDTVTLNNWVDKDDEDNEPIGFDWSSTIEVDSVHTKSGDNNPVAHPGGMSGSVNTGAGKGEPAISFIVFCFDEPVVVPSTFSVELKKEWDVASDPDDIFDEELASATLEATPSEDLLDGAVFNVAESDIDTGNALCVVTETSGLGDVTLDASLAVEGVFTHTVTNTVECQDLVPVFDVELVKVWDVVLDPDGNFDESLASADLLATPSEVLVDGDEFVVTETNIDTGNDLCVVSGTSGLGTFTLDAALAEEGVFTHTVTNTVVCGTETIIEREVPGEDTETIIEVPGEDTTTVVEVEVPGETIIERRTTPAPTTTAAGPVPTSIPAGSGGYLPNTGIPAFVLFLMGAGALLLGGGVLSAVRSRS